MLLSCSCSEAELRSAITSWRRRHYGDICAQRLGSTQPVVAGVVHVTLRLRMAGMQHSRRPPTRREQFVPPHVPHVPLQQTGGWSLLAWYTIPSAHGMELWWDRSGNTHPVILGVTQSRPDRRIAAGQQRKGPPGLAEHPPPPQVPQLDLQHVRSCSSVGFVWTMPSAHGSFDEAADTFRSR